MQAEGCQERHEERSVEILAELVEDKPVTQGALAEVGLDLGHLGCRSPEVAVHSQVDQLKANQGGLGLRDSVEQSKAAEQGNEEEPPPENQEDFVIDHVESEDADSVDVFLCSSWPPSPVVARSWKFKVNYIFFK